MIVNVKDLDHLVCAIEKNRPIGSGDAKAVDPKMLRFEKLGMQSRMQRIYLKESPLFLIVLNEIVLLEIRNESFLERNNMYESGMIERLDTAVL